MDCEDEWGLIEKPSYDIITSNGYHRGHSPATNKRHSHSLRGYQYLISLMVNPAQFGFVCPNLPQRKKFKGLGALNQYFDMLVPNQGVSTIPDVWEGYYRITLAYFDTNIPPVQLEEVFNSFQSSFNDVRLHEGLFRSSKLDLSCANFPLGYKFSSEPIALYVSSPHDFLFESLLEEMKQLILPTRWIQTPADQLHMNIRLYSNDTKVDEKLKWTWHRVCETGLPKKVGQHPIEFYCSRLEIIPSRKTCQQTCSQRVSDQWWLGVTELDGKCSACQTPIKNGNWNGTCFSCEQYESIKPIWFIPYTATVSIASKKRINVSPCYSAR
jgi:hypothetical protein